jgi:hypothetical protein
MSWIASSGMLSGVAMTKAILATFLLLVTSCHKDRPPAPTPEQNRQLNDAEDMLNAMARDQEGPEANAPGPSNRSD